MRRQIFAQTNDGQLAPYTSWADFGQHLKHPESLVNFVAAYGTHPTHHRAPPRCVGQARGGPGDRRPGGSGRHADARPTPPTSCSSTGSLGRRAARRAASDAPASTTSTSGSAASPRSTNLFGGLLGSTFNYVFQNQMENLQNGDRFYYLARTPGMNLRTQLEGNSLLRDDPAQHRRHQHPEGRRVRHGRLQVPARATSPAPPAGFTQFGSTVADDPTTDCDENLLLLRKPDGTIQYQPINSVDPAGINGQSVYNGNAGVDRVYGGNDNDTFWGGDGNDVIEGNGGDDVALGGEGNDIITDLDGADVLKGGPGNDAIDAGPGDDIIMGGDGQDFINGGANDNETFAGPGNDFIIAGQGADAVFGDGGDDWIEGGSGQDLLIGDHGAPFFDDPAETAPGHDIFIGQVGENDYDAEGGDDIMSQNAAVDRNAGAGGFDWAIHQYDTVGADDDMAINNNLGRRCRSRSSSTATAGRRSRPTRARPFNDVIKGTDDVPAVRRWRRLHRLQRPRPGRRRPDRGLSAIVPQPLTGDLGAGRGCARRPAPAPSPAPSGARATSCSAVAGATRSRVVAATTSSTATSRLQVRISVRTNPADPATEIGRTDLMEGTGTRAGNAGKTLQQAVFDGTVDPGQLVAVREIVPAPAGDTGIDTAVFLAPRASYTIAPNADGSLTVTQTGAVNVPTQKVSDGVDTLRGIERLQFTDQTVVVATPSAPTNVSAALVSTTTTTASASVSWTAPVLAAGVSPITTYNLLVSTGGVVSQTITGIARTATSSTVTGLARGTTYTFQVQANNLFGAGALSTPSNAVTPPQTAPTAPAVPTGVVAVAGNASANLSWTPGSDGGSPVTGWIVQTRTASNNTVVRTTTITGSTPSATITALTNGTAYNFRVRAVNAIGTSGLSVASNTVTPTSGTTATVPSAPIIGVARQGGAGGAVNARAVWSAPASDGGSPLTNYRVNAYRVDGQRHHDLRQPDDRRCHRHQPGDRPAGGQLPVRGDRGERRRQQPSVGTVQHGAGAMS